MNFTLLVAVLLTAIAFVGIVIALSNAIAPRSYNVQKMEPYVVSHRAANLGCSSK